ncbi:transmembrane reductase CYB561D2-like [Cylas formicarius]|uniref:transmembrane reductase CYB561D2-like n=1 Tax=Cylas formicarius TaxID=197179 RepID=UPI002958A612|nr:transmembrane reductase CYB561D2-like [Cylas formicarius]
MSAESEVHDKVLGSFKENVTRFLLNYVARFALAGVVLYSSYIALIRVTWFTWHVILCTAGYVPLMAESIILFLGDELWTRQLNRTQKYWVHGILISLATFFIIVGNALVFHKLQSGYHLYTAHGITGLISMILIIAAIPVGLAINYANEIKRVLTVRPLWYKAIHNFLGLLGYVIGIISLAFAFYTKWFVYYTGPEARMLSLVATILGSIWMVNGALVSMYHQIKSLVT